jgi:hypothetical protein
VTPSRLELVRALTTGFGEVDFETFRDALAEASDMDQLAARTGSFGELNRNVIDPEVEVELHGPLTAMIGERFNGWDGWLEFWRGWLDPWEDYSVEFSGWTEVGDAVVVTLDIEARGRGSGVQVSDRMTQGWTVAEGRVIRLDMFASRRKALAALRGVRG